MKNILKSCLLLCAAALAGACSNVKTTSSDEVEQRIIFPQYFVHYDEETEALVASAKFNVNNAAGEVLKLVGHSEVKFNGKELSGEADAENNSYHYVLRLNGALPDTMTFSYENNDGELFVNAIHMTGLDLKEPAVELSKTSNTRYMLGRALGDNETMACVFISEDDNEELLEVNCYTDSSNVRQVIVFAEDLSLCAGKYRMRFVKRGSSTNVNAMDRGGSWETEFFSKKMNVEIRE